LPDGGDADEHIAAISEYLIDNEIQIFIPNYRKISYAAAALSSRSADISVVGVCHNDHESYYETLLRYQDMISVFICASAKTRSVLESRLSHENESKVTYIPHYVQLDHDLRARFRSDTFTVLYHGRLQEEQKHCSEILRIAERVLEQQNNVHFRLIGDGADKETYTAEVARRGWGDRITFSDSQPWADLQFELASAQLAILTSSYEGFCYGAAEALATGLPVVAYDCGEVISDFLFHEQNGYITEWGRADQLADWIVELSNDEQRWQQCSNAAVDIGRSKFSFSQVLAAYDRVLMQSLSRTDAWPLFRPAFIPEKGKSLRSFWEKVGRKAGAWA
tara:strand:+ start:2147 stop:3151 length:1005 start_codon:yes stop_codon:yes gene_type:complete